MTMPPEARQLLEKFNHLGSMLPRDHDQILADPTRAMLIVQEMRRVDAQFLAIVDQAKRDYRAQLLAQQTTNPRTARSQKTRDRKAAGRMVLQIEVNQTDICELLIAANCLQQWDDGDRTKIARAIERLLAALVAENEGSR